MRFFRSNPKIQSICRILSAFLLSILLCFQFSEARAIKRSIEESWKYDKGPDLQTEMGQELLRILADQPYMPGISLEITGTQKFRPAFGPTLWRMLLTPNSVKVLFIGQDGTHIAEAAGRTATAGFGGRAQDLASYLGVNEGAAFINTFAYTIQGQYGVFESPHVFVDKSGKEIIRFSNLIDNGLWLMAQDQDSPMVKWRNRLLDWIIRNNRESLKLIVTFGGSARDSVASFIESKGRPVKSMYSAEDMARVRVPKLKEISAGGNNVVNILLDKDGDDLIAKHLGRTLRYKSDVETRENPDAELAKKTLQDQFAILKDRMSFEEGGLNNSGLIHPAQIGGYDLDGDGKIAASLKGLALSDGSVIGDVLVVSSPHPTALSMMGKTKASEAVKKALSSLDPHLKMGWSIPPDEGMVSTFTSGQPYVYGRASLPSIYYDFGTPNNRMVAVSDASRLERQVIVLGTRERAKFDLRSLEAAKKQLAGEELPEDEMFIARPRTESRVHLFDSGPGEEMAKIIKSNLNMNEIGRVKSGMDAKALGIKAYNIKSHPTEVGDFGHYRGTFVQPRVLILADPDGYDDLMTSRALTGARGQYLQTMMKALGLSEQYLLIKTVPFGMDGATDSEWSVVLAQTKKYRQAILEKVMQDSSASIDLIITDGEYARQEMTELLEVFEIQIPVVSIKKIGLGNNSGIEKSFREAAKILARKNYQIQSDLRLDKMSNIPRSHLPYLARNWEGTSGDRVLNSVDQYSGIAFAIVAPNWAVNQKVEFGRDELVIRKLKNKKPESSAAVRKKRPLFWKKAG